MLRPDLTNVTPEIRLYIEHLEKIIATFPNTRADEKRGTTEKQIEDTPLLPDEPPTSNCVISITGRGVAKRTYRHLYSRQRRGGMGIFDIDTPASDPPIVLCVASDGQTLLVVTNMARAFRLPVSNIEDAPVRAHGSLITNKAALLDNEVIAAATPIQAEGYLTAVSRSGMVRSLRHHVFGEHMKPGMSIYDVRNFGSLASVCWSRGDSDLFIASKHGRAIRFNEKHIPPTGCLGIRLAAGDEAVSITSVTEASSVFLLGADGKGTIRVMRGFSANKSPGAGGKIAMDANQLIAAQTIHTEDDIFIISKLCKIIRFQGADVPEKEGVVQGVNCMSFRADEVVAMTTCKMGMQYYP